MRLNYVHYHNKRGRSISVVCVFPFSLKVPKAVLLLCSAFNYSVAYYTLSVWGGGGRGEGASLKIIQKPLLPFL